MVEKRSLKQALDELKSFAVVLAKSPMKGIWCFFPTSTYMPHGCRYTGMKVAKKKKLFLQVVFGLIECVQGQTFQVTDPHLKRWT